MNKRIVNRTIHFCSIRWTIWIARNKMHSQTMDNCTVLWCNFICIISGAVDSYVCSMVGRFSQALCHSKHLTCVNFNVFRFRSWARFFDLIKKNSCILSGTWTCGTFLIFLLVVFFLSRISRYHRLFFIRLSSHLSFQPS